MFHMENPVIPIHWGAAQKGMQANKEVGVGEQISCQEDWLAARDYSVEMVEGLLSKGIHKQIANRLLEPWMWITVIHSATEHANFFKLRCHHMAEPHMSTLAYRMRAAMEASDPVEQRWHMPLIGFPGDEEVSRAGHKLLSVARCARVSYLTHEGIRDVEADLRLAETLRTNGHFSPWEHVAHGEHGTWGNFRGWKQLRWYVERRQDLP